jgi:predicted nucleotidyltransferase
MVPEALRIDLDRYVALLEGRFESDLVSVVVFGSRVRGQAKPESDIHVLVVIRSLERTPYMRQGNG